MAVQKIVKGSDASIVLNLKDKSCSRDSCKPYSLENFTGASGQFLNDDDTVLTVLGELLSADAGRLQIDLTSEQTELLKANDCADFVLYVDIGSGSSGTRIVKNVEGKIGIYERVF